MAWFAGCRRVVAQYNASFEKMRADAGARLLAQAVAAAPVYLRLKREAGAARDRYEALVAAGQLEGGADAAGWLRVAEDKEAQARGWIPVVMPRGDVGFEVQLEARECFWRNVEALTKGVA